MTLAPLPNGDLLVAAADPTLAVLDPDGGARWAQTPRQADFRYQVDKLAVAADGQRIDFGYEPDRRGHGAVRRHDAIATARPCRRDDQRRHLSTRGCPIQDWRMPRNPTLDGAPLALDPYEISRSLAIYPKAIASFSAPSGRCAPTTPKASRSGCRRCPA